MYGTAGIPKDWQEHIGDTIITKSLNCCLGPSLPKTCTALTDRVVASAPIMLAATYYRKRHKTMLTEGASEIPENALEQFFDCTETLDRLNNLKPYTFEVPFGPLAATVTYDRAPELSNTSEIGVHVRFSNNWEVFGNALYNLSLRWITPEGFSVEGPRAVTMVHHNDHQKHLTDVDFVIRVDDPSKLQAENRLLLEVEIKDHYLNGYVPMVLLG
jgi:hypothetical protein